MGHDIFVQQRLVLISERLIWWAIELEWGFDCNCRCLWGENGTICLWGVLCKLCTGQNLTLCFRLRCLRLCFRWILCLFCSGLVRRFTGDRFSALLRVFKGWMVRVVPGMWSTTILSNFRRNFWVAVNRSNFSGRKDRGRTF